MNPITLSKCPSTLSVSVPPSKSRVARKVVIACAMGDRSSIETFVEDPMKDIRAVASGALSLLCDDTPVLFLGQSGTALRLLTALSCVLSRREVCIEGDPQLYTRPIAPLVEALRALGASVRYKTRQGYAPVSVQRSMLTGGVIDARGWESSQYVSALLLIGPLLDGPLTLLYTSDERSHAYVSLTVQMMQEAGAKVETLSEGIRVFPSAYLRVPSSVQGDWSSASYWVGLQLLHPEIEQLKITSLQWDPYQADSCIVDIVEGLEVEYEDGVTTLRRRRRELSLPSALDLSSSPDLFPLLAVCYCVRHERVTIRGLSHLKYKESDRLSVVSQGLRRMGYKVWTEAEDTFRYDGEKRMDTSGTLCIDCHDDHRVAMSFAIAATALPLEVSLSDPQSVSKSYPDFFFHLRKACTRR